MTATSKADSTLTASASVTVTAAQPSPAPSGGSSSGGGTSYAIKASAGEHGNISPAGTVRVSRNGTQRFTVTPDAGYEVYDVLVDDKSVGPVEDYAFEKVTGAHTILAQFVRDFEDVAENSWYHDAVRYAVWHELFRGTGDARFSPDDDMSRAMLAAVLYRAAGEPAMPRADLDTPFADVEIGSWYGPAVCWAHREGILYGTAATTFAPNASITRAQLAAMLHRWAGSPVSAGDLSRFTDAGAAEPWAVDALRWATETGLLTGKDGGRLDPQGPATRAEVAALLMRYLSTK